VLQSFQFIDLVFSKYCLLTEITDRVNRTPSDVMSLERNRPMKRMYLTPCMRVVAPGVVINIQLVAKNMTDAMKPPAMPAFGF